MVQMTLHLTRSSRPWTFPLLGFEVFQIWLQKRHFNGFYRDTHRRDFRPFEDNSILYIEGEKCMIFPKVQFVARGRSPRATKHRGKNEHSLQKYIYYFFHGRE
jgi:hypothetical protein